MLKQCDHALTSLPILYRFLFFTCITKFIYLCANIFLMHLLTTHDHCRTTTHTQITLLQVVSLIITLLAKGFLTSHTRQILTATFITSPRTLIHPLFHCNLSCIYTRLSTTIKISLYFKNHNLYIIPLELYNCPLFLRFLSKPNDL